MARDIYRTGLEYNIFDHRHNLAVWAAARASSRGVGGVSAKNLEVWISELGLKEMIASHESLPSPNKFDLQHRNWRCELIKLFENHRKKRLISELPEERKPLNHGGAAKMINIYLKVGVVCAAADVNGEILGSMRKKIGAIHPPVDSILLDRVPARPGEDDAAFYRTHRHWSTLDCAAYESVISRLQDYCSAVQPDPIELWKVESHWSASGDA